ncbi:Zinc finger and BTB domain-containing protein 16 [Orchesella cincta]|uniref:Zinc finger and BTB domain-containing protein 16 n=1 Tax=Orchesella cincta TaxID=48709 RepID=A0A1D2M647_ORCCI|nr:Zinc finger and BTB domain-containing protein 16 [Orchesella cincta]
MASSNIRPPNKVLLEKEVEKLAKLLEITTLQFKTVQHLLVEPSEEVEPDRPVAEVEPEPVPGPSGKLGLRKSTRTRVILTRMQQCPLTPGRNDDRKMHGLWKTKTVRGKKAAWFCHCKMKFHSHKSLRNHFVIKTQYKNLRCPDQKCCKTFHLGEQLKRHCREVHGRVVFSCSLCYKQFEDETRYKNHVTRSFIDNNCAKKFEEKRRKREPIFSPLREGAVGCYSVRDNQQDDSVFDINEFMQNL